MTRTISIRRSTSESISGVMRVTAGRKTAIGREMCLSFQIPSWLAWFRGKKKKKEKEEEGEGQVRVGGWTG